MIHSKRQVEKIAEKFFDIHLERKIIPNKTYVVGSQQFFFLFSISSVKEAFKIHYQTKHYNDNIHRQASFELLYVFKRHERQIVYIAE